MLITLHLSSFVCNSVSALSLVRPFSFLEARNKSPQCHFLRFSPFSSCVQTCTNVFLMVSMCTLSSYCYCVCTGEHEIKLTLTPVFFSSSPTCVPVSHTFNLHTFSSVFFLCGTSQAVVGSEVEHCFLVFLPTTHTGCDSWFSSRGVVEKWVHVVKECWLTQLTSIMSSPIRVGRSDLMRELRVGVLAEHKTVSMQIV